MQSTCFLVLSLMVALSLAGCGGGSVDETPVAMPKAAASRTPLRALAADQDRIRLQTVTQSCMAPSGVALAGVAIANVTCADADAAQVFEFIAVLQSSSRGTLKHEASGLCADASDSQLVLKTCDGSAAQIVSIRDDGAGNRQARFANEPLRAAPGSVTHLRLVAVVSAPTGWTPTLTDTWQWQLQGAINTSYDVAVYDIDLFETPQPTIDALKAAGKRVICYFSAGSSEDWRGDFDQFKASELGANLDGWAGERWLDTRSANVRTIMKARLDHAVTRGCDGVEPDNMDGYLNSPGLPLTKSTQLDYNQFIGTEARARGLRVGLKNAVDLLGQLEPYYDFAVNEQCHQYEECGGYAAFTSKGKPVFNAEYASKLKNDPVKRAELCAASRALNIRTLVLPLALDDSFRYACD